MNKNEPININEVAFERAVLRSPMPVLVDFWAAWCGPCKMLAPVLEEIAREQAGQVRVDMDENGALAARFGVRGIPALLFFTGASGTTLSSAPSPRGHPAKAGRPHNAGQAGGLTGRGAFGRECKSSSTASKW